MENLVLENYSLEDLSYDDQKKLMVVLSEWMMLSFGQSPQV